MESNSICSAAKQLVSRNINFVYVDIFNLLIKVYLSLIFIKYLINKSIVKIKFL
jgi:hypothetical protein